MTIGGTAHPLTQLVGGRNAEYLLVLSDDLASGFEIAGDALFNPNCSLRSTVAYQAQVGVLSGELTDVPVPATAALPALGLIGLGVGARVRRRA